jgi:hypothetical protein
MRFVSFVRQLLVTLASPDYLFLFCHSRLATLLPRLTIRMPHLTREPHRWRCKWIVLGKLELGGEDTALERRAFGTLNQGFPEKQIVLGDGTCGDAIRGVIGQVLVFL